MDLLLLLGRLKRVFNMSVKNINECIVCENLSNVDSLVLYKDNDVESSLVLASISIRDYKMLSYIKSCLKNNQGVHIHNAYKPMGL